MMIGFRPRGSSPKLKFKPHMGTSGELSKDNVLITQSKLILVKSINDMI